MGDSDEQEKRETGNNEQSTYTALGAVFAGVGVVFMITMESAALGLPFIALGIAFFTMGISAKKKPTDTPKDDEPPST